MSEGNFLKIASVIGSVPFAPSVAQTTVTNATNELPILETGQGDSNGINANMLGVYMLPASVPSSSDTTTYVQLPAEQIHRVVQQVVEGQPPQPVVVSENQVTLPANQVTLPANQVTLPANFVIQAPIALPGVTSSSNIQLVGGAPEIVQQTPNHLIINQQNSEPIGTFLDRLISNNETILKGNDVSALKPKSSGGRSAAQHPRAVTSVVNSKIQKQNPVVSERLSLPPGQSLPPGPLFKTRIVPRETDVLLRRVLSAGQKTRLRHVIVRPQSPTKMCTLKSSDESMFCSSLVQIRVKGSTMFGEGSRTKGAICGLMCKAKVKVTDTTALPTDIDMYWCNFCPYKSETKLDFLQHIMTHRFHCWICQFQAFSRADVIQHCISKHPTFNADPWFYCSLLNDHLKLACKEDKSMEVQQSDEEYLGEELKGSNYDLLDLEMEDQEDFTGISDTESLKKSFSNSGTDPPKPPRPQAPSSQVNEHSLNEQEDQFVQATKSSWNCKYCDFVSQDYKLILIHCTIMHPTKEKVAKEVKVSAESALQIRKLDTIRQLHLDKGEKEFLQSTESVSSTHRRASESKKETQQSEGTSSKDIRIYECFHCNGQSLKLKEVSSHLQTDHCGDAFIAIDLKAVRLKQARFIVFCPRPKCHYSTSNQQAFLEHIKHCCLQASDGNKLDADSRSSMLKTIQFAKKNMRTISRSSGLGKGTAIICAGCKEHYPKSRQVKDHTIEAHSSRPPFFFVSNRDEKGNLRNYGRKKLYFCPICMVYQTPLFKFLNEHIQNKHGLKRVSNPAKLSCSALIQHVADQMNVDDDSSEEEGIKPEEDVKPNARELENMMEKYLEDETQTKMATMGSSSRHAAVKADVKLKNKGHVPNRYNCRFCKYQCLGVNLIRTHLQQEHEGAPLIASDCSIGSVVYICPKSGCIFRHKDAEDLRQHCAEKHELLDVKIPLDITSPELLKFSKFPPAFECLYCETSLTLSSTASMREHVTLVHKGEVVVMRDVVARRQCISSRIYMCADLSCDFVTRDRSEYSAHMEQNANHAVNPPVEEEGDATCSTDFDGTGPDENHAQSMDDGEIEGIEPMDQYNTDDEAEDASEVMIEDTTTQDVHRIKLEA